MSNTDSNCPFCHPDSEQIFLEADLVLGLWDRYPVSPGHALLIPRRHVANWFDATQEEQQALTEALSAAREIIEKQHKPDAYNIGINAGQAAGQTIFHLHVHLIPRYQGDQEDPRGGVRSIFPAGCPTSPVTSPPSTISTNSSRPCLPALLVRPRITIG